MGGNKYNELAENDSYKKIEIDSVTGEKFETVSSRIKDWLYEQEKEYRENDPDRKAGGICFRFDEDKAPLMRDLRMKAEIRDIYEVKDLIGERNIYDVIFEEKRKNHMMYDPLMHTESYEFFDKILKLIIEKYKKTSK